ncbi:MAG TPA: hypothetical protein VNW04_05740, partial [Puia sp.]|nr:hypothetical protein [Puia sp.]
MPTLLPPLVVAPLSECSKEVRVQNQLTGSVVEVLANGVHVGGGPATWSDQVFPLTSPITAGQKITARQTLGPDTSAPTPAANAVEVQAKPAVIGHVGFSSPMYVCGECLHMDGLVPGATVDVKLAGNPAGSGTAYDGTARVHLTAAIPFGQPVVAQQHACGAAGLITNSPVPDLYGGKREGPLPAPAIATPLYECQTSVTIYNVLPGATVTVTRSMGAQLVSCFDYSNEHFDGIPPLKLGEVLTATQAFPKCQRTSPPSAPVK